MKKFYKHLVTALLWFAGSQAQAQYSFTSLAPYQQNFDALGKGTSTFNVNGTNNALAGITAGYKVSATIFAGVPINVMANDGGNSTSAAYNFGTAGATDRALGGIAGGTAGNSGIGYIAVRLRNEAGVTIKNLDVRYAIEQWYNSTMATDAYFRASYRVYANTTSYSSNDLVQDTGSNGWQAVPELDLQAPATGGITGRVDGNSDTYRRTAQHRLTGINMPAASEVVIRFTYVFNSTTNGNGISLDDIVVYPETNVLYSKTAGMLDNDKVNGASTGITWGQNPDGTGPTSSKINFAADNVTYYIQSASTSDISSRISGNWQVTGSNSRVVVGTSSVPATLVVANNLAATVDVGPGSTLLIQGAPASGLVLGSLNPTSTVQYASSTAQNVLPAAYATLSLSGNGPKTLTGSATVLKELKLTGSAATTPQVLSLGANNLTLLRGATLTRTNGGQVVTNGLGEYRATVIGAGGSNVPTLFPVATSGAAADYTPASLTAGSSDRDDTYRVRVVNSVFQTYSNGAGATTTANTGNVNKTWFISHETSTPVSATLKLGWAAAQQGEAFKAATAYIDHYNTTTNTWDGVPSNKGAFADDGQLAVQRTGISSFSPFAVTSNSAGPLPVRLVAFAAQRTAVTVVCTWATASEQHNSHFIVERSLAGVAFEALGTVGGQGTQATAHTYAFVDKQPAPGLAYYRLRQVDTDGTATYSPVVAVAGAATSVGASLAAAPNPSTGLFDLSTTLAASAQVELAVYNTLGQPVLTTRQVLPAGSATLPLDLRAQPAGVYVVRLQGAGEPLALRLLKQ